jgi:hypothetical protein
MLWYNLREVMIVLINSIEKWNEAAARLSEKGYTMWQSQFAVDHPEGFYAWFMSQGLPDVEIITRNKEVHDAILRYKPDRT